MTLHTLAVALIAGGTITLLILLAAWASHPRYRAARARAREASRHAAPLTGRRRRLREARATRAKRAELAELAKRAELAP